MGRQPDGSDKLLALATESGYKRGEHREKDADPVPYNYVDKTVYDHDCALRRYVM
jgi:hypothetical protein